MNNTVYIPRHIESKLTTVLTKGKSILLLGPRQTGKTTLIHHLPYDRYITLARPFDRIRYEKEPFLLTGEIESLAKQTKHRKPLVIIDEIQKVPPLLDAVQDLIDEKKALFILTGSSARKLRMGSPMNWLPGRVISMRLDPFMQSEIIPYAQSLEELLLDGSLPEIALERDAIFREELLESYVTIYLEEEIRAEALVRQLGDFARFLELAAAESGKIVNMTKLSQEIGVTHTTIAGYYQILEDCLVVERVSPITASKTRRKLSKSQKYILYDLGVRRIAAREGRQLPREYMGHLFEQYVGLELIRLTRENRQISIKYWRDPQGPEVDWVVETANELIPIEVKLTDKPQSSDAKYLQIFLNEYPKAKKAYIVCQTPHPIAITEQITALPWDRIADTLIDRE